MYLYVYFNIIATSIQLSHTSNIFIIDKCITFRLQMKNISFPSRYKSVFLPNNKSNIHPLPKYSAYVWRKLRGFLALRQSSWVGFLHAILPHPFPVSPFTHRILNTKQHPYPIRNVWQRSGSLFASIFQELPSAISHTGSPAASFSRYISVFFRCVRVVAFSYKFGSHWTNPSK